MAEVDWSAVNDKLPYKKDAEEFAKRKDLWKRCDVNGNGIMSLAEIDKAVRDVLGLDEVFDAKPAIMRAFQAAKDKSQNGKEDYIEFIEFRFFLLSLRQYFEYWVAFGRVDSDGDRRVSLEEFIGAKAVMEVWVGAIEEPEAEFAKIDTNDGGIVLFDEFCKWAIKKNLDLADDEDMDE